MSSVRCETREPGVSPSAGTERHTSGRASNCMKDSMAPPIVRPPYMYSVCSHLAMQWPKRACAQMGGVSRAPRMHLARISHISRMHMSGDNQRSTARMPAAEVRL